MASIRQLIGLGKERAEHFGVRPWHWWSIMIVIMPFVIVVAICRCLGSTLLGFGEMLEDLVDDLATLAVEKIASWLQ